MKSIRRLTCSGCATRAIAIAAFLSASPLFAQTAEQRAQLTSLDTPEWLAMDAALKMYLVDNQEGFGEVTRTQLPGGRVLETGVVPSLPGVGDRARRVLDAVCAQLSAGNFDGQRGADELGQLLETSEQYEAEDITSYYNNYLASLPPDEAQDLARAKLRFQEQGRASHRNTDWREYARLYPAELLADRANRCQQR